MRSLLVVAAASFLLAGCEGGVAGEWRGSKPTVDKFDAMSLEETGDAEGDGTAKLYIFRTIDSVTVASEFEFDIDWRERETLIDIDFACQTSPFSSGCEEEDSFDLNCEVSGDDDEKMTCETEAERWIDYDFRWRRVEE